MCLWCPREGRDRGAGDGAIASVHPVYVKHLMHERVVIPVRRYDALSDLIVAAIAPLILVVRTIHRTWPSFSLPLGLSFSLSSSCLPVGLRLFVLL